MDISPELATYVFLLLPGLIGHALYSSFTFTKIPTWSGRTVIAIMLSAAAYISLGLLREWHWLAWIPDPRDMLNLPSSNFAGVFSTPTLLTVSLATVLSIVFSLLLTKANNHRLLHRVAGRLGLTSKSGFVSEFDSVMIQRARSRWVMLLMKDGSAFTGWLESHEVATDGRSLVLSKIREYDAEGLNFAWPSSELLYLDSLEEVRALRLIPPEEEHNDERKQPTQPTQPAELAEPTDSAQPTEPAAQDPQGVSQYEPATGTEVPPAGVTNEAVV